ncbi:MAG: hypothetical protein QOC64_1710, partial [Solirubrobacteraceae bacterium]|nr:hypothetical protein [Solirubrobacteraceae bacterium]
MRNAPAKNTSGSSTGETQVVHPAYDDPVIAGRMLGDDLAFQHGQGAREQRHAAMSRRPVPAGEAVRAGEARGLANRSCSCAGTFTPKCRARRIRDHVSELREGQNDTSGGSS